MRGDHASFRIVGWRVGAVRHAALGVLMALFDAPTQDDDSLNGLPKNKAVKLAALITGGLPAAIAPTPGGLFDSGAATPNVGTPADPNSLAAPDVGINKFNLPFLPGYKQPQPQKPAAPPRINPLTNQPYFPAGMSTGGKVLSVLMQTALGGLAGRAASEQAVIESGGRRSGGVGLGAEAGLMAGSQRALAGQRVQAGAMQNQATQMQLAQANALKQAYKAGTTTDPQTGAVSFDKNKVIQSLGAAGQGAAIPGLMQSFAQMDEMQGKIQKQRDEHAAATNDYIGSALQAIVNSKDPKTGQYDLGTTGATLAHIAQLYPQEAEQLRQAIVANPGRLNQIVDSAIAQSPAQSKIATERTAAEARSKTADVAQQKLTLETPGILTGQQKSQAELANLPTPTEASAQRQATLTRTRTETAKAGEELGQLKRQASDIGKPDPTGFQSNLSVGEYNKRYDAFSKSKGFGQLQTLQGSYGQFQDVLSDLDAGKPMTGAASVVALFNAIGISAEPLAGKGFRINNNTVQEHVGARGLDQAAYQKLLSLKNGDVITPQQVRDYASIASSVYKNAYVISSDEAHRQGLPADFLPQGGGVKLDGTTAEIFARTVLHQNPRLAKRPVELKAAVSRAAQSNGWDVGQ